MTNLLQLSADVIDDAVSGSAAGGSLLPLLATCATVFLRKCGSSNDSKAGKDSEATSVGIAGSSNDGGFCCGGGSTGGAASALSVRYASGTSPLVA